MSLSVLILTFNEAHNITECIGTLKWCNDVVVLDSFSTDQTVELASSAGARVLRRHFDGFASQRNYALDTVDFKHDWILHLDADERVTPELARECQDAADRDEKSGYLVPSKMIFMDRWLKHAATYPVYQMRFAKRGEVRFIQRGHGQQESESKRGLEYLQSPYLHYPFSKGMDDWMAKHRVYAKADAQAALIESHTGAHTANLLSSDPILRRRALKQLASYMPFRPMLRFLYMYGIRMGFLDGRPGFTYCQLMASYERMVVKELAELRKNNQSTQPA